MKVTAKEAEELYEWGVKFYEMGFEACLQCISKLGGFAKEQKANAVREFIANQELDKDS